MRRTVNPQELNRLLHKVETGEILSDEELRALEREATAQGGLSLKLSVAHALLNAEATEPALGLLKGLEKDFPNDAQVPLAMARAHFSVERYAAAEAPLKRVLQLNPADLEAMKGLALIAMRRGEQARAEAWVKTVLEKDPFDAEAQQLMGELESAGSKPVAMLASLEEFVKALRAGLAGRAVTHLIQKERLFLKLADGDVARLELKGLHQSYMDSGQSLDDAVTSITEELTAQVIGLPAERADLLSKVLPVLRDDRFAQRVTGLMTREGPAGLCLGYALEHPDFLRYLPLTVSNSHGVTLEEVDQAAWANLAKTVLAVHAIDFDPKALALASSPTGLWALARGDGHDAARLLLPNVQSVLREKLGDGPWRVYLGLRELVLLCREDDAETIAKLDGLDAAGDGIAGAFIFHQGSLKPLDEWRAVRG